jgi:hypothetical protein
LTTPFDNLFLAPKVVTTCIAGHGVHDTEPLLLQLIVLSMSRALDPANPDSIAQWLVYMRIDQYGSNYLPASYKPEAIAPDKLSGLLVAQTQAEQAREALRRLRTRGK